MQVTLNLTETQWNVLRNILEQLPKEFESTAQPDDLHARTLDAIQQWEVKHRRTIPQWCLEREIHADPALLDDALNELLKRGEIEFVVETPGRGRPKSGYRKVRN
jgi:hypothetical protein